MKKYAILIFASLVFPLQVLAEKTLVVDFSYPEPNPKEYRFYMDGKNVCQSLDGAGRTLECKVDGITFGTHTFTMTAVDQTGVESNHSPPFVWNYLAVPGESPKFLNIRIVIDGKNIELLP